MEPSRLIRVEISSASLFGSGVCRVSGERMSHSEKRICSIAEKEPRRVTYGASLLPWLVRPVDAGLVPPPPRSARRHRLLTIIDNRNGQSRPGTSSLPKPCELLGLGERTAVSIAETSAFDPKGFGRYAAAPNC
jgi:hypothetical protein